MATHSIILAWRIPWTEEPGGLSSLGHTESDTTERLNKNNKNLNAREGRFLSFLHFTLQSQFRQENKKKKERTKPSGSLEHSAEHLRLSSHVCSAGEPTFTALRLHACKKRRGFQPEAEVMSSRGDRGSQSC